MIPFQAATEPATPDVVPLIRTAWSIWPLFGFVCALCFLYTVAYLLALLQKETSTSRFRSFSRIYAFLSLAGIGIVGAFGGLNENITGSLFTLLGTIAGFLAGARVPEKGGTGTDGKLDQTITVTAPRTVEGDATATVTSSVGRNEAFSDI